jgi:transposase
MTKNKEWTDAELEQVTEMRRQGKLLKEVAKALDRSMASVRHVIYGKRLSVRNSVTVAQWLEAFSHPHTIDEVAKRFGLSKYRVQDVKRILRHQGYAVPDALGRWGKKVNSED